MSFQSIGLSLGVNPKREYGNCLGEVHIQIITIGIKDYA